MGLGYVVPKSILKKINRKRTENGIPLFEEEERKRKERESEPCVDVRISVLCKKYFD
jgi:hypothetical protein